MWEMTPCFFTQCSNELKVHVTKLFGMLPFLLSLGERIPENLLNPGCLLLNPGCLLYQLQPETCLLLNVLLEPPALPPSHCKEPFWNDFKSNICATVHVQRMIPHDFWSESISVSDIRYKERHQPIIWQFFPRKLHKNKNKLNREGHEGHAPPWIRHCIYLLFCLIGCRSFLAEVNATK